MEKEDIEREKTTQEIVVPPYLVNFTSFGLLDVKLPDGFADVSSKNEVCPRFDHAAAGVGVWVNFKRIEDRRDQVKDRPRFWVYITRDEDGNPVDEKPGKITLETDDWQEVLAYIQRRL